MPKAYAGTHVNILLFVIGALDYPRGLIFPAFIGRYGPRLSWSRSVVVRRDPAPFGSRKPAAP